VRKPIPRKWPEWVSCGGNRRGGFLHATGSDTAGADGRTGHRFRAGGHFTHPGGRRRPTVKAKIAKHKDGPFKAGLQASLTSKRKLYVRVKSLGDPQDHAVIEDVAVLPGGWERRWFKGQTEITTDATASGYQFHLGAGKSKVFRIKVTRDTGLVQFTGCTIARAAGDDGDSVRAFAGMNQPPENCDN
jgi:hypothetical protein